MTRLRRRVLVALLAGAMPQVPAAYAQDAAWVGTTGDWNTATNWAPAIQPTGAAIFDATGAAKTITFSALTTSIGTMEFNSAASSYAVTVQGDSTVPVRSLILNGSGIVSSLGAPTINVLLFLFDTSALQFSNASGAGSAVINNSGSSVTFNNSSSAQNASINNFGAITKFLDSSTAGNATILNTDSIAGPISESRGASFFNSSTAGNAQITNDGPGAATIFHDSSTAGNSIISSLYFSGTEFLDTSSAGNASISGSTTEMVTIPGTDTVVRGPTDGITFLNSSTAGNATLGPSFEILFENTSSAGTATIINDHVDGLIFYDNATAGSATITTTTAGYRTFFLGNSNGGQARFINVQDGAVDFSFTTGPLNNHEITAGSIEGTGTIFLGANQLTVGGNNLSTTFGGQITDTGGGGGGSGGSLVKTGTGMLALTGTNTYTGGTAITGGILLFGQPAAIAGSGPNVMVNSGGTAAAGYPIDQPFIGRIAPASQGVVALAADSGNNLDFSADGLSGVSLGAIGTATYSGTLTPAGNTYRLGGGGGNLVVTFVLTGSAGLLVNAAGSPGIVTLDAINTYTGLTEVAGGTLLIGDAATPNASVPGAIRVDTGAVLRGHGTVGGNVSNAGTVYPGASIGVLTVTGNYSQGSVGTLTIEVTPNAGAGAGVGYDQLKVGGTATLAGTLRVIDDPGTYAVGSRYTIVTAAGGRSGTFSTVGYSPAFAAFIAPVVSYDANNAYLSLDPAPALFASGQQVPDALTAMTSAARGVADVVLDDICSAPSQPLMTPGQACVVHPLAGGLHSEVWLRGLGGLGNLTGGGSHTSFQDHYAGTLVGYGIGVDGFTVGVGAGYLSTGLNFSGGSNASQQAGVGLLYGRYAQGPLWFGAVAAFGGGQIGGARVVAGTGLAGTGNRGANFSVIQARAAYDLLAGPVTVEPRLTLAYLHAGQASFSETGAGMLDLSYSATHADVSDGRATVRIMQSLSAGSWTLQPWVEAGVQQTFSGQSRSVTATDGAVSVGISGISPTPTAAVVGAGMTAAVTEALDLFVTYQGQFAHNESGNAFSAGALFRF